MRKFLYLAVLVAACNSNKATTKQAPAQAAAADPWAKKDVKPSDVKDPDLARLIDLAQNGPGTDKYPQADAYVDLERDDIKLAADGTITHHHKSIAKLFDAQRGKEKFADVHVPFDQKRQTLKIDVARTVNDDGLAHAASPEEIGDIVPAYLSDATTYSDVRERVVSFPAVDKGSVVELEYTRTTRPTPDSSRPSRSRRPSGEGRCSGTKSQAKANMTIPTGTLMKKTQRQESVWVRTPPMIGAVAGPRRIGRMMVRATFARRSGP